MIKFNFTLCILNILSLFVYMVIFFNLKQNVSEDIMFSTSDAQTYYDVVDWLKYKIDSESVSIRPLLYPLILLTMTKFGGVNGVWIIQVIFWLLSINFTFMTIKNITKSNLFSFFGVLLLISNLSLITLTLHALTEVTTAFLLSMMLFFMSRKIKEYRSIHFFHTCLFFMVLLTILKPTFYIPLLCLFFVVFPSFYLRKHLKYPINFLKVVLIILPLIIQISIIYIKYGHAKVSLIGTKTISRYIVPQGIQQIESISFEDAVKKSESFSESQQWDYIQRHASQYFYLFLNNIKNNIKGNPTFLLYPKGYENYKLAQFTKNYNYIIYIAHFIFFILIFPLMLIFIKNKNISLLFFLGLSYLLGFYFIVVTGISFMQGDRLTLPSIAIWANIYPIILFSCLKLLFPTMHISNGGVCSKLKGL